MSVVSTVAKIFGAMIIGLFLFGIIATSAIAQFTEHDNIRSVVSGMLVKQFPNMTDADFTQMKTGLTMYCQQTGAQSINLADISPGSPNATLRCTDIAAAAKFSDLASLLAAGMIDGVYYKQYSCEFVSCLSTLPDQDKFLVIITAHANAFFKQAVMWCIGGLVIGLALMVLGIRKLFGIIRAVGVEVAVVGVLGYIGINSAKGMLPAEALQIDVVTNLFATMANSFMIALVIGIVLVVVGFVGARFAGGKAKKKK